MPKKTRQKGPVPAVCAANFYTVEFAVRVGKTRNKTRVPRRMEVDVWATSPEEAVTLVARKLHIDPSFDD